MSNLWPSPHLLRRIWKASVSCPPTSDGLFTAAAQFDSRPASAALLELTRWRVLLPPALLKERNWRPSSISEPMAKSRLEVGMGCYARPLRPGPLLKPD